MSVLAVDLYHLAVPLKKPIRHASHERSTSDNLVVRVSLATGEFGFGEGIPRPYVTGETIASTFDALASVDFGRLMGADPGMIDVLRRLRDFSLPTIEADPRGMFGNAARCAVELAILDAFGRKYGESVGEMLRSMIEEVAMRIPCNVKSEPVRYSGAITAETERKEVVSAWKMRLNNFSQVKVKVGVEGQDDPARLARIRRILWRRDIRIDANEAWPACDMLDRLRPLARFAPSAIEQPVSHEEVGALADLRPKAGIPVMLDESLCGYPDGERAVREGLADLFNVRLSKCGGIFPSLRLIGLALRSGLGVQLGCHPGETGLLTAAGRHVASRIPAFRYVEGSYDRHVLARNLTVEDPTFGYGGWAKPIREPGLGVTVDPEALERLCVDHREIRYD